MFERIKALPRKLKTEARTLWYISKHPGTPWYTRALAAFLVTYALSPIDLIPDFIPVVGLVDDCVVIPLGIYITFRTTPQRVVTECRIKARKENSKG